MKTEKKKERQPVCFIYIEVTRVQIPAEDEDDTSCKGDELKSNTKSPKP